MPATLKTGIRILGSLTAMLLVAAWLWPGLSFASDPGTRVLIARGGEAYPPYEFLNDSGQPDGFNIDIIRAVARVMGLDVQTSLGPWREVRAQLERSEIDIITGMYYSTARAEKVGFSSPHIIVTYALFTRRGSDITSLKDIAGRQVLVQEGDYGDDYLNENQLTTGILRVISPGRALKMLARGKGDCALLPRLIGLRLIREMKLDSLTVTGSPVLPRKYCLAVTRGDTSLLAVLNEGLSILHSTGEYDRIYAKWFGEAATTPLTGMVLKWLLLILAPVVVGLCLAVVWSWSLKRQVRNKTEQLRVELADREAAEKALRESEERLRLISDNLPHAFVYQVIREPDGPQRFSYLSRNVEGLLGVDREDILADMGLIYDMILPSYLDGVLEADRLAAETSTDFRCEFPVALPGGGYRWLDVASTPRGGEDGSMIWEGVMVDITESKEMAETLRHSQKMEAVGTLAGGVAHDFNNILAAIMGFSELALDSARSGQDNSEEIENVLKSAQRARELVRQILAFSRKADIELKALDINDQVGHAVDILRHTIPKMIDIRTGLDPGPTSISGDANQLEQVLLNLATNAVDAMPEGGTLTFRTGPARAEEELPKDVDFHPDDYIRLEVADTGIGMDSRIVEKIFNPFFTTKEIGKGTGLGLSTAYGIISDHNGYLTCSSIPGRGTTFTILLPRATGEEMAGAAEQTDGARNPGGGETLLLVDDESTLREMGRRILEKGGYRVLTADSGEEALDIFSREWRSIDLVILDLGMPGMGGHHCLTGLLDIDPQARVIIVSGYSAHGKVGDTLAAGARSYVSKPFGRDELLAGVRKALDGE